MLTFRTSHARLATAESSTDQVSESADNLWQSTLDAVPRLGLALAVIFVGAVIARLLRSGLWRLRSHTESFANVMSKLVSWIFLGLVVMIGLTVTFPSVKPVDLLAGLGFFSVAVGFAFQDILENTLSGVLLLFRQPFQSGDQIEVDGNEGTVEAITIRETRIRKYDGQLLVVPNRDVYKNAIRVQTDQEDRRINFMVGVAYEADLDAAQQLIERTISSLDCVDSNEPVDAFVLELAASTVNFDVRFWVDSSQYDARKALDQAIRATKRELDANGVEMPCDIVALQATPSFRSAMHDRAVTPGGSPADEEDSASAEETNA